jgi:hypothetical protein
MLDKRVSINSNYENTLSSGQINNGAVFEFDGTMSLYSGIRIETGKIISIHVGNYTDGM